jgi:hypothetical protein
MATFDYRRGHQKYANEYRNFHLFSIRIDVYYLGVNLTHMGTKATLVKSDWYATRRFPRNSTGIARPK